MKLFNFHILKQKTLDDMCKRLAEDRKKACEESAKQALVMPNKMISALLRQIVGRNKTLIEAYREAQIALREKVRNAG